MAHISEVESGLACGCVCPGCGLQLVARKGQEKAHHFGHYNSEECAYAVETALHKLAKEVLAEKRQVLLPPVGAKRAGRTLVTHQARVLQFDAARLEKRLGEIIPDVIVASGDKQLLVEMFVTHRADEQKIERIRQLGIASIEIDLRQLPRHATRDEVSRALTSDSPRHWLFNPKVEHAERSLEEQLKAEQAAAERRTEAARADEKRRLDTLAAGIARNKPRSSARTAPCQPTAAMRRVKENGLTDAIGLPVQGDAHIPTSNHAWQAELLSRFVLAPLENGTASYLDFGVGDVIRHLSTSEMFGAIQFVRRADADELTKRIPDFASPARMIAEYLEQLDLLFGIVRSHRNRWAVSNPYQNSWRERRRRTEERVRWKSELQATVQRLLRKANQDEVDGFDVDLWWQTAHPQLGISPADAFDLDDRRLPELSFRIHQLDRALSFGGELAADLAGLPLEGALQREKDARRAKEEEKRAAAEAEARAVAQERRAWLVRRAADELGSEATLWSATRSDALNATPAEAAAASDQGLAMAEASLTSYSAELRRRRALEALRARLLSAANAMRRPEHAHLFLTSSNPLWQGRKPVDCCTDERNFEIIVAELKRVAG